ncbi:SDR family oxidoreductase [Lysobacter sp. A286]
MTIADTGATGQLGRLLIERLRAKLPAADIVALARTPSKAADWRCAKPTTRARTLWTRPLSASTR